MKMDSVNLHILKSILSKQKITTWSLSKSYPWEELKKINSMGKQEILSFYGKKCGMIEYRLKCMTKEGFVLLEKNGDEVYIVDENRVKLGKKCFINGRRECLEIMFSDGKCVIFEI